MITIEKARRLREAIEQAVPALKLSDRDALECAELYPQWAAGKLYPVGDRVRSGGRLYTCLTSHTSQEDWAPPEVPALWGEIRPDEVTGYNQWQRPTGAHDAYNAGDRVVYSGMVYESTIQGNTWAPDEYPAGWRLAE